MLRSTFALLFAVPLLLAVVPAHAQPGRPNTGLPTTKLTIGTQVVTAEIAATDETRQIGLMHRFSLPPDHGMLFVHDAPRMLSFWMRNTYIPLSIAFIDANGAHHQHRGHGTAGRAAPRGRRARRSTRWR